MVMWEWIKRTCASTRWRKKRRPPHRRKVCLLRRRPKNWALKAARLFETLTAVVVVDDDDDDDDVTGTDPWALGNVRIMRRRSRVGQYFHYFPSTTRWRDDDNVAGNTVENARETLDKFFFSAWVVPRRIPTGIQLYFFSFFFFFFEVLAHTLFLRQSSVRTEKRPLPC